MSTFIPSETATTAAAEAADVRSHQVETAYPPPSCSAFHGRSASSEVIVITRACLYSKDARGRARWASQVWEWTSCADPTAAAMDRSVEPTCSAWLASASSSQG